VQTCPACRREDVPDAADVCPYCHARLSVAKRIWRVGRAVAKILIGLFVVIFIILLATCVGLLLL
jgi:hypothetical protein